MGDVPYVVVVYIGQRSTMYSQFSHLAHSLLRNDRGNGYKDDHTDGSIWYTVVHGRTREKRREERC